jgi:hypothetical protein
MMSPACKVSRGAGLNILTPSARFNGHHPPVKGKKHILGHLHMKTKSVSRGDGGEKEIKTTAP